MSPGTRLTIGVSGPDGAGKTTLVDGIVRAFRARGYHAVPAYCYGCVVCRRSRSTRRATGEGAGTRPGFTRIAQHLDRAHSVVDAAELSLRLGAARARARTAARGRPFVVVTDRGPLDGLVKFEPRPGSVAATVFARLSAAYDATLMLDAIPEVLGRRDGEHSIDQLAADRARYRRWAHRLRAVVTLDAGQPESVVVAEALSAIERPQSTAAACAARVDPPPTRKRVVISIFDNAHNTHYGGGGAVVVDKVARRLSQEYRTTVVTAARRGGIRVEDGVVYRYLPIGWAGPRAGQLLFHVVLPFVARALQHDLWIESFTPPFSTSFLPAFSRAPVLGLAQQLGGEMMSERYHLPFWMVERVGLRLYRNVVAINEIDGERVRRRSPMAAVQVIPNGVDFDGVEDAELGRGEHILFMGRIDVLVKGIDLLLEAFIRGAPTMPLVIAGSGRTDQEGRLGSLLARVGREVRWVGHVTGADKRELLARSAFMVMPSRIESFGIAALESMSCGKPVLHFDLPSLRWMHGAGDVAVPAFDVDELGRQMRMLAADASLRRRLGGEACRAAQRYSWDNTTGRYLSIARALLDQSARPGEELQDAA
jgi:glycosyltransferase involved in cell wall biosynthesis